MKKILFILFLIPVFSQAQLVSFVYSGDTLKAFNPSTAVTSNIITSSPSTFSIGTVASTAPLTVANFRTSFPTPQTGTLGHFVSSGISINPRISFDAYNSANVNGSIFQGRRAGGSAGTPTAATTDYTLAGFTGDGYGTDSFHNVSVGAFVIKSEGTMTNTSAPTYLSLMTTPSGSTTIVERMRIKSTGVINIPTLTTAGILQNDASGDLSSVSTYSAGQFLRRNGANTGFEFATLAGGGDALTSAPLSQFAATTSAQLTTNAGGTFIPSVNLVTAAAAVVGIGSYFRIWAVGVGGQTFVGQWN